MLYSPGCKSETGTAISGLHYLCLCCLLLLLSLPLNAQQPDDDDTENLFDLSLEKLMDVVVTPSRFNQSAGNVTQKIDVITSREIESHVFGNRNLCEVLSGLPGISVSVLSRNDANWGTYGGIGPKYNTYMLEGLPVDAFTDPMSLDLNIIDKIEVQHGPASVLYPNYLSQDFAGIQSPLAGTVNIILKQKVLRSKTIVQTSYGSYNTLNGQFFQQSKLGNVHFFMGATYDLSDYTNYGTNDSWLNMQKDPEYRKTKLYGGITLYLDKKDSEKLTVFAQGTWHTGDKGRIYQAYDNQYATLNAGYEVAIDNHINLQSHLGVRSYDRTWQESTSGLPDTLNADAGVSQLIVPFDLGISLRHGKNNLLNIGMDYQEAKYSAWTTPLSLSRNIWNKSSATQTGIYTQEEWQIIPRLLLRAGLRYSYIRNKTALLNGSVPAQNVKSWDRLLWSAGVKYSLNSRINIFANAGSSFAAPSLKAIGGTIPESQAQNSSRDGQLPNPGLKPEWGIGTDMGTDITLPYKIKITIRGFYTVIKDAIVENIVSQKPSRTRSENAHSSSAAGTELEFSHQMDSRFSWYTNITYLKTSVENDPYGDGNDNEIPFSPDLVANFGLRYHSLSGFTFVPELNYNDGYYDGIISTNRRYFRQGFTVNAYIAQTVKEREDFSIECFIQLFNMTNNKFEMPWQFRNPGISAAGGVRITF